MDTPFSYAIDPDARLAYGRMWGEVHGTDMLLMIRAVHQHAAWQDGFDAVWDCGAVTAHIVLPDDVEPLVAEEARSGDGKDVLVESSALGESAFSEMLAAMVRRRGKAMTVCTTLDAALASLGHAALPKALAQAAAQASSGHRAGVS